MVVNHYPFKFKAIMVAALKFYDFSLSKLKKIYQRITCILIGQGNWNSQKRN